MILVMRMTWTVIFGCLGAACVQDMKTKSVYRFVWWIGGVAAVCLLWLAGTEKPLHLLELLMFTALQHLLFSRFYGRADCRAFCLCAAALASLGAGLYLFLMQMLVAFFLLALVQAARRNVASDGNLSHPVAFLPYITIAFLLVLWYYYT